MNKNYQNKKIGMLLVIKNVGVKSSNNRCLWFCVCDCGNRVTVDSKYLNDSKLCNCGCQRKEYEKLSGLRLSESKKFRKHIFNESIFERIDSEEKSYWLGFIMADGYVNDRFLKIKLIDTDYDHLVKFKNFIEYKEDISKESYRDSRTNKIYKQCSIKINSVKLIRDLKILGLDNNKSFSAHLPEIPTELQRHFWRGVIDGDGCLFIRGKMKSISLVGTKEILDSYINFFSLDKFPRKHGKIYSIVCYKEFSYICKILYENSNIYLERKYKKYLQGIKNEK